MAMGSTISKAIELQNAKLIKDIVVDFLVVYMFVPLWITLLASALKSSREQYVWTQSFIGDLIVLSLVFILVAIPLNYLRFQASDPSHFLYPFRIETTEKFMEETRSQSEPSLIDGDVLVLTGMIISYGLWNPFQDQPLSEISFFTLYSQSLVVLAVYDAGFYWLHRMFHTPKWYKYHKKHHEVRNSVASRVHHVDAIDGLITILPLYLVPVLYQICGIPMVHEVWIMGSAFMQAQLYISHCDLYLFSTRWSLGLFWGDSAICHSNHHFKNQGNFGPVSPLIWDWICDTRYKDDDGHQ